MIGEYIGRYHVLEQLGEGGMATVFKAFDTRLDREVALKVILATRQQSPELLARFEREAKALAKLSHPNIVKVLDYGEHEGSPYLVMEYVSAGTLKAIQGQPMPSAEAAALLAPIARALEYAHSRKIIHRDVKPSNILITESGQPMLSDFGIAKVLEAGQTWDLTGTGVGIGTPEYMAPEQGVGGPVDHRADIYALGIVLYQLVTGRTPFHGDTPMAVLLKQMNEPLPRPRNIVRGIPVDMERVIFKALAKRPEARFEEMAIFAECLEREAQHHNAVTKERPGVPVMKRLRLMAAAAIAAVLLSLVAAILWIAGALPGPGRLAGRVAPATGSLASGMAGVGTPTMDMTSAVGLVHEMTATSRADRDATATVARYNVGLTATMAARAPTNTSPAAPTSAPIASSVPGLTLYDGFDVGSSAVDTSRWKGDDQYFSVENGAAVFRADREEDPPYFQGHLEAVDRWRPATSGPVRFSVETRIQLDSSIAGSRRGVTVYLQLIGPVLPSGLFSFNFGYKYDFGLLLYECNASGGPEWEDTYYQSGRGPGFDEWRTFRISMEESQNMDDLALVAYLDNREVCRYVPPAEWQESIDAGGLVSLILLNYWDSAWDLDVPLLISFDSVSVGPLDN